MPVTAAGESFTEVVVEVLRGLETSKLPYMIVGSVASSFYGDPRLTKDLDLVIDIPSARLADFKSTFSDPNYYLPPDEVLTDEISRRGRFNLVHMRSGLKVDIVVRRNGQHSIAEFARRLQVELWPGVSCTIASPEDVIIKKLEYFREGESAKHLSDIRGILASTTIEHEYLNNWIGILGLAKEWSKI